MTFVMECAFDEAIKSPMDNGLTNQSPPPPQVSPLTVPLEYPWSDVEQDEDNSY